MQTAGHDVLRVAAVGDLMLGDHPLVIGRGVASICRTRGYNTLFKDISTFLQEHDVGFGNLEAVLAPSDATRQSVDAMAFRACPSAAFVLRQAGFNMVSVANNHALQHGLPGLGRGGAPHAPGTRIIRPHPRADAEVRTLRFV